MAKLVRCKTCGQEIAKTAKRCPNCGAKQHNGALTACVIIILITLFLVIGVIAGSGDDSPKPVSATTQSNAPDSTTQVQNSQSPEKTTFGVGEKAELNDIVVSLVNVRESTGGNYMAPSDGKIFVICEFEIENNSKNDIAVSSVLSFEAYIDDYSTSMSLSAMMSDEKPQLDGSIAAGKKMNGIIGYETDPEWSSIEIRFKDNVWSSKEFIFEYSK